MKNEELIRCCKDVELVVDGGAGYGWFTQEVLRLFPDATVFLFEPNETLANYCRDKRLYTNVIRMGLGDRVEKRELILRNYNLASSFLENEEGYEQYLEKGMLGVVERKEVSLTRLDEFFDESTRIDLLKLDLQGYELKALEGAGKLIDTIRYIFIELCYAPLYKGQADAVEVLKYLEQRGFKIAGVGEGDSRWQDVLFERIV